MLRIADTACGRELGAAAKNERIHSPPQRNESFYAIFSRKNCGSPEGSALWRIPHRVL